MLRFSTKEFSYNKAKNTFTASVSTLKTDRYPQKFELVSSQTGVTITFFQDDEAAMRNEWWDGEYMEYINRVNDVRVVINAEWR